MTKVKNLLFISANLVAISATAVPQYNISQLEEFEKTHFCENCDLTNSYITGNNSGADLMNANLDDSYMAYTSTFSNGNFKNSTMNQVIADIINFSKSDFSNAQMTQSSFKNANFSNVNFNGAIISESNFDSANFIGSNITQEQLATAKSICNAILPDGTKGKCN